MRAFKQQDRENGYHKVASSSLELERAGLEDPEGGLP